MPAGFRPPGAPHWTRQPRVRSRLRSESAPHGQAVAEICALMPEMVAMLVLMVTCINSGWRSDK